MTSKKLRIMVTQILYFFIVLLTGSTSDGIEFLAQGTIWPDILESEEGIKAHHNAGGLPEDMNFELVEPVRILFKDEVPGINRVLYDFTPKPTGTVEFE